MNENENDIFIEGGAFILARNIFDNNIWNYPHKLRLFLYLIGKANHQKDKPFIKGNVVIGYGQYLRSYRNMIKDLMWIENNQEKEYSLSNLKRMIDDLKSEGRILTEETKLGTLFTVCNYDYYQELSNYRHKNMEQQENINGTLTEQLQNNNNNYNNLKNLNIDNDKVVFENYFFKIRKSQINEWKKAYPNISNFSQEVVRVSDILTEKKLRGEHITQSMAYLHTHLKRENNKGVHRSNNLTESPKKRNSTKQPKIIGDILKEMLLRIEGVGDIAKEKNP